MKEHRGDNSEPPSSEHASLESANKFLSLDNFQNLTLGEPDDFPTRTFDRPGLFPNFSGQFTTQT